jgi:hypothetical protein
VSLTLSAICDLAASIGSDWLAANAPICPQVVCFYSSDFSPNFEVNASI